MSSPPGSTAKRQRLSSMRTSLSNRTPLRTSQSSLPVPSQPPNVSRIAASQPSYDFIGGEPENAHPAKRTMLRKPSFSKLDHGTDENLRAKVNSLDYELKNLQQERNMVALQHDKEMRDLQAKADTDFKKYQASESAAQKATQRYESLQKEMRDLQDQSINEKAALERRLRDLQDQSASSKEDAEDAQARLSDSERHYKHQLNDVEAKRVALQETVDKLRQDLEQQLKEWDSAQSRLLQRDADVESLEAQVLELKTHAGDSDALSVLQTQLTEQVAHIRNLETANREQTAELRKLRDAHRSVQVVEEQKRGLETELQVLKDVERQLGEAQIQKEILLDEKRQWTSLLERDGQEPEFASPEAVVKALVEARIEAESLAGRIGGIEAESSEKDEMLKSLDAERKSLQEELDKAKATVASAPETNDNKAYKRLERQKNLAVKETEYLRAQLSSFDSEETMENPSFDTQRAEQIKQLKALVDQYKTEVASIHAELSSLESAAAATSEPHGTKRRAESQEPDADNSAQLGPLLRKNKNLQMALQKTAQQSKMLATELQAAKTQLKSLRESAKTRVLELRDNPTANAEAIKMATLRTLKEENRDLLGQLRGENLQGVKVVPVSTLDALKLELQDMETVVADKEKRMRRQREIWTDKAAEFRDVVASVLGWKITFMPNGKAKVSSMFYGRGGEAEDDEDEHYIIFDGENGTMKISGGADGDFAREIKEQIDFWVKEKKEIPGFLAALTIQFHDEYRSR
ncbi:uncharacterized protein HMPREF1541_03181 [Cyphellophora europaea CBS 101466]|uniref:Spindle assembly checkpoint component MAD1 n=1 Tax=Cyphellophora europaea (strain CBS 101466) TaxID=1220924 RepID=W2RXJ4_CYPE1|nr:uncharacterized protein HMPREF1541_03181 [Cyphellophora europaea CBS 101466]ETN41246.1 hypothetical protein HMPREF1541_03181 [Cyphellophora europaea CBS 101466]